MDRGRKMAVYHREGVRHVWLIDPLERTLEVYARDDVGWELAGGFEDNALVRVEPFDEVPLELGTLWLPRSGAAAPEP
jgi:Uma2 family endonuclease